MHFPADTRSPVFLRTFAQVLSSTPRGARLARLLVVEILRTRGIPQGITERVRHVVAELCANAVLHGCRDGRDFRIAVVLLPTTGTVRIEVTDSRGDRMPERWESPPPHSESGRGTALIDALADRWGTAPQPEGGKTVWAEIDPPPAR
ncbi:ATP-binding protein [Streptomyces calidiresistens]|uniref:ATP-binding protein n=1 Tax=Streptomyces calidiresistens TaxID=1485586 RepID=A0A7W3T144_9ACTN|nr:ATP-binding protein [Streptomyces calidiresistens]MBB0228977.1 ATP-binding protein [Streptomyces calidiresistens]